MEASARTRARAEIVRLVHRGLGMPDFASGAARVLRRAVPFDGVCVLTMDPATLLPTSEVVDHGLPPAAIRRLTEIEVGEADFNKFTELARARRPAASLSDATRGDLDRSLRQRELRRPNGLGDELRVALVADSGTWGAVTLQREVGRAFSTGETSLLASLSSHLAEGVQRALLLAGFARDPEGGDAGLLVLAGDDTVEVGNAAAPRWLDELGGGERGPDDLPPVVVAVAARARLVAGGGPTSEDTLARARVRASSGRWLLVRGSLLGDGPDARVAVILEPVSPPDLAPLIAAAYGLTDREQRVTQLVAQGLSTDEIARRLHLSPYTVQDHLKSIFGKVDVGTRGELVARIFFEQYAPRLANDAAVGPTGWFSR